MLKREWRFLLGLAFLAMVGGISAAVGSDLVLFVGAAIWGVAQITRPIHLVYVFLALYPFAFVHYPKPTIGPVTAGFDDLLLVGAMGVIGLQLAIRGRGLAEMLGRLPRDVIYSIGLVLLFLAGVLVSSLAVAEPLTWVYTTAGYAFAFFATVALVRTERQLDTSIGLLKLAALVLAVGTLLSAYGFVGRWGAFGEFLNMREAPGAALLGTVNASSGFIQNRGGYGVNMAFILPFVLLPVVDYLRHRRGGVHSFLLHLGLLLLMLWSIIVTSSRSTWLMAVVVVTTYLLVRTVRRMNPVAVMGILVPAALAVFVLLQGLIEGLASAAYELRPITVESRVDLDLLSFQVFLRNPVLGIPHEEIFRIGQMGLYIHNFFLVNAVDSGLIGVLPLLILFGLSIRMMYRLTQHPAPGIQERSLCLIAGFTGMLVELMFYAGGEKQLWVYLGLICVVYALSRSPSMWPPRRAR